MKMAYHISRKTKKITECMMLGQLNNHLGKKKFT